MNHRKKNLRLFVQLHLDVLDAPAWRAMGAVARCLYLALRRRHNRKRNNNGEIFIGQREAADELGVARNTIGRAFQELEHYGFIVMTSPGRLGIDGQGRAPHWRLTEIETANGDATMDFKFWDGTLFQPSPKNKIPAQKLSHTVWRNN